MSAAQVRPLAPRLAELLDARPAGIADQAVAARGAVLMVAPDSWELVYETYALSVAFSWTNALRDAFCHVAVYREHVNLGFNRGAELQDPAGLLRGTGKLIRHVRLTSPDDLAKPDLTTLIEAAAQHARARMKSRTPTPGQVVFKTDK